MNDYEFEAIFKQQIKLCEETLLKKGVEYSKEYDRLHNFKVAACLQNELPRQALGGMLAKHVVSIFDLINTPNLAQMSVWEEKIGDSLNYLFLLKAIIVEEQKEKNVKENRPV